MKIDSLFGGEEKLLSIEQIKDLAERVVVKYIASTAIPSREKSDVVMAIVEKFLQNRHKIDKVFEGRSKITTYYIAVFNRMCCEVIRKEQKHWHAVKDNEFETHQQEDSTSVFETEKNVVIKDELKRLNCLMQIYNGQGAKINLFARYYFRIPVTPDDIHGYCQHHSDDIFHIVSNVPVNNQADIFNNLAQVISIVEGKQVKGDAVRMWLHKRLDAIVNRINMNGVSNHTRESLKTLMEMR
ncbi:MAG: hypothetical protein EA361_03370 [Bacteroidetes bacterium]|nr:MAG: hypothetical protein EA361_03370 [Bacteroidota bacterium]